MKEKRKDRRKEKTKKEKRKSREKGILRKRAVKLMGNRIEREREREEREWKKYTKIE